MNSSGEPLVFSYVMWRCRHHEFLILNPMRSNKSEPIPFCDNEQEELGYETRRLLRMDERGGQILYED